MQIGIDIRPLISREPTGVGFYTYNTLKSLFKVDHNNQYKLFFNSAKDKPSNLVNKLTDFPNVTLHSFRRPNKFFNACLTYFKKPNLDQMIGGCDIFWFPNLNFWQVSKNCKTIITVHDLSFKRIPWAYSKKMRLWHNIIKPQDKLSKADKIISVSQNTKDDLINLYNIPENKIDVVYPGVTRPTSDVQRPTLKFPQKYILYLGTLEPRKNVEGVIKAFEKLNQSDLHLVIAGQKGWLYKNIYKKVKSLELKDKIIFLDYVNQDDRFNLYKNTQLFVWPSFYEGFGFPPLEAMSVGYPVITSSNSSLPEVVGKASLLVDPYNVNEISQALSQILSDDQLRQDLINKGYDQVKKYNWEISAEKILKLFESLE